MSGPASMNWPDISAWRKAQRAAWIAWREAVPQEQRLQRDRRISGHLRTALSAPAGVVIGFCWPFRGEFDARFAVRDWRVQGAIAALPEVVGKGQALRFRQWWPGAPMTKGVYDIPLPDGTPVVLPDVAIVPMNAYDGQGYRLGYGGGYFDRTLAALGRRVIAIGVTYDDCCVPSIFPQAHDLPMDFVVTEGGIRAAGGIALSALGAADFGRSVQQLMMQRRLPRKNSN